MSNLFDFAEKHDLALLEVHAGAKNPVGDDWQHRANTSRSTWEQWTARGSNIGLHPGASRIAVMDIEGGKQEIAEDWFRKVTGYSLPKPHVRSPSGGTHTYFLLTEITGLSSLRQKATGWGDLLIGNANAMLPPSYFANRENKPDKKAGYYEWLGNETLYDGEPLRRAWPTRQRCDVAPSLDGYRIEEVSWWIDRKIARGDWGLSQQDWAMFGGALKLHFGSAGLELFQRMSEDPDQAARRFDKFEAEYSEGDRKLSWYLKPDITWMFRETFGCPILPRCPVSLPLPAEIVDRLKREREQHEAALLGPLPDHPELPIDQAHALAQFWAHLPSGKIIHESSRGLWASGSFDKHAGRIKDAMKAEGPGMLASTWLSQHRAVQSMGWDPGEPMIIEGKTLTESGWVHAPGCRSFNTYLAPTIAAAEGDVSPWLDHIRLIYPNEADRIVEWFAHRVQMPGEKVNHGLVFIGDPGVGKDTAIEPVIAAIGAHNFRSISAARFFKSDFNGYLKSVMLRIDEVHDLGGESKYAFHDRTKPILAAPPAANEINEKFVPHHSARNVCGVILTSNHADALYLDRNDRRHFVCITDKKKEDFPDGYFDRLYAWFDKGGNEAIAHYLATLDLNGFNAKAPPPKTAGWHLVVAAGLAPESGDLADAIEVMGKPAALTIAMIRGRAPGDSQLRMSLDDVKLRKTIPKRLGEAGYIAVPNPEARDSGGRWRMPGGKATIYARRELSEDERLSAARLLSSTA